MKFLFITLNCLLLINNLINAQQNGDAASLNPPNCGLRPLVSKDMNEPSKIVGGTQALVGKSPEITN